MSHSERVVYIAATLIGAVFVLLYRGPYWTFVRAYAGDWLVVQFIYVIARFWIGARWRYPLAAGVLLLGVLVEVVQLFLAGVIPRTFIAEVTIGSSFDPLDIIAYLMGLMTVLVMEQALSRRQSRM